LSKTHWGDDDFRIPVYYVRFWIQNSGRGAAEHVEVFIVRLLREIDDRFVDVEQFLPMNLRWSHATPPIVFYPRIAAGLGRHCDLGHIVRPADRELCDSSEQLSGVPVQQTLLSLDTEVAPHTGTHLLPPPCTRWISASQPRTQVRRRLASVSA
jgi:hypothetical protein